MEERTNNLSLAWFLILAVLFHLLVSQSPVPRGPGALPKNRDSEPLVVERYEPPNRKQIVQTQKAPDDAKLNHKAGRFSGAFKNRVEEETRAKRFGKFQAGSGGQGQGGLGKPSPDDGPKISELLPYAMSPDRLPKDIPTGESTMLNTDPMRYASFFNRMMDQIYEPWKNGATQALESVAGTGRKLESRLYTTHLRFLLNRQGQVTSIQVMQSCGLSDLDEAPRRVLWRVGSFPNPPAQIFDASGFAQIDWRFELNLEKSLFSIGRFAT